MSETKNRLECPEVLGLTDAEQDAMRECFDEWMRRRSSNMTRLAYYKGTTRPKPMGIALSPDMERYVTGVSGWGRKAVDSLGALSQLDTYLFGGEPSDVMDSIIRESDLVNAYNAAVTSELMLGCAFVTVTKGAPGEPDVMVSTHSALHSSGIWSNRLKRLVAGLVLVDADKEGNPTAMNLFTEDSVIELYKTGFGQWGYDRHRHSMGRCLMEVLRYRPVTDINPMGQSRLTRAAMNIIDRAQEEIKLTAISAQFFSIPQKYLLGVDKDFFENNPKWDAYCGAILGISPNKNGDIPTFGQLPQGTMQPHIDLMRQYACEFSGETCIPVASLGVIHDNPSSAEAMLCTKDDLITEGRLLNTCNFLPMRNIGIMAMATALGTPIAELDGDVLDCEPRFLDPMNYSPTINADFAVKYSSINQAYAQTRVCKERLGFTNEEIARMDSDQMRAESRDAVQRLMEEAVNAVADSE